MIFAFIAGTLTVAICACGEQKRQAEERGKAVGETLKNAEKSVSDAATQIQENAGKTEQESQETGEK